MSRHELRRETDALGGLAIMQSAPAVQALLQQWAAQLRARVCLDIGTFTGGSALAMAEGAPDATVVSFERNPEWAAIAEHHWRANGVADRVQCVVGEALPALRALTVRDVDLVFIDADKGRYAAYYATVLPLVRPGGLLVFDDTAWFGMADAPGALDYEGQAIAAMNRLLANDPRVQTLRLSVGNGVTVCTKLGGAA